jgi:hypothetical protein
LEEYSQRFSFIFVRDELPVKFGAKANGFFNGLVIQDKAGFHRKNMGLTPSSFAFCAFNFLAHGTSILINKMRKTIELKYNWAERI